MTTWEMIRRRIDVTYNHKKSAKKREHIVCVSLLPRNREPIAPPDQSRMCK